MSKQADGHHDDDTPIGRVLTRREVFRLLGGAGLSLAGLSACSPADARPVGAQTGAAPDVVLPAVSKAADTATPRPSPTPQPRETAYITPTQAPTPSLVPTMPSPVPITPSPQPATAAAPVCVVKPALTEGPYFVDDTSLNRSDIRANSTNASVSPGLAMQGAPFELTVRVWHFVNGSCVLYPGVVVDLWHCDAIGRYSGVQSLTGQDFLRGYQITDANGEARFTTIYPGWYPGRAVHFHFKVRMSAGSNSSGVFTSQFFFDDDYSRALFLATPPYSSNGAQDRLNSQDGIYRQTNGQLTLNVSESSGVRKATFELGVAS
jgi:protocatechuate 3,4-dioxygenase beta subunit